MKRPGSLLRLRPASDSEEEVGDEEAAIDQSETEESVEKPETSESKQKKIRKKGIIYISSIPKHMNVAICKEMMERFGEVGRIFLQPDSKGSEYHRK